MGTALGLIIGLVVLGLEIWMFVWFIKTMNSIKRNVKKLVELQEKNQ